MRKIKNYSHRMLGKLRRYRIGTVVTTFVVSLLLSPLPAFADADDLSGVMESVKSDFGTSSTFIKLLYLAEILASVYAYHKTKNVVVLGGIVVLSIFVNYALGHWVFTA